MEALHSGEINQIGFILRVHHLAEWENLLIAYNRNFTIKPWDFSGDETPAKEKFMQKFIGKFIKDYVLKDIDLADTALYYFENSDPDLEVNRRLAYYRDLIGTSKEEHDKVANGRIEMLRKFFNFSQENKNGKVLLTVDSDSYCKSCAVGEHCKRSESGYLLKDDRDYVFKNSLANIIGKNILKPETLKWDETGENIVVSVEALFDNNFYKTIWEDIINCGNGEWL
ncbi:MAG TPA: hypothetical protein VKC54_04225 [Patescibacteria group bacterium]|nr:hypothetical protein [Patescibacteria group bacterium]